MAMASPNNTELYAYDMNLETFSLIWLDERVDTADENRQAQQQLRASINYLKAFNNKTRCKLYILSASLQDRIVLIISGQWGQELVPEIHHLRQISSIYVYCINKQAHEQWAKYYPKVKSVTNNLGELITRIKFDQEVRLKVEEPFFINYFTVNENIEQSTTGLNGQFVHSLLLIDALLRLKSTEKDKQDLITLCQKEYKGNTDQLAILHEFKQDYSSDRALSWYTRESFLCKMLNKALRVQNIDVMFLFRFFITDIYQQLKQHQCESPVRVYRGQMMSKDELKNLRRSVGNFISINSFFSTSTDHQEACNFLPNSNALEDLCQVLFVIDAHPHVVRTKPFANISAFSDHAHESEVLFMVGSVFRLTDISRDYDRVWIINMELYDDDQHDMRNLFQHMKKEYGGGNKKITFRIFGDILRRMSKYDLAEKMYRRSLNELPPNSHSFANICWSLGIVTHEKGDYDSSLQWFQKSLEIQIQTNTSDYVNIANLYNWIGECYRMKCDYNQALVWYSKAIELFKQMYMPYHPDAAHVYNNIAFIYDLQKKYLEALDFNRKALKIREIHLPSNHPDIARSHHSIGIVQNTLCHYDLALEHYNRSLAIQLKSLPHQHPDIGLTYASIGNAYEAKVELTEAITYYQKAADIYRQSWTPEHPYVIKNDKDIRRVASKLK